MKGVSVTDSPSVCWRPPVVYPVALLNGGSGGLRVVPVFGLGLPLHIVSSLLYCLPSSLLLSTVCVLCHSIVGLCCVIVTGLCHCGIAVAVCVG